MPTTKSGKSRTNGDGTADQSVRDCAQEMPATQARGRAHSSGSAPAPSSWQDVNQVVEKQIRADGVHQWPFVPSLPVDVRSFTFDRTREQRQTHHDYFELLYLNSGRAVYEIKNRRFNVGASDLIVINGALPHRLAEVAETPCNAVVLYFNPDFLRTASSASEHVQYLMPFLMQDEMFPPLIPNTSPVAGDILNLILRIQKAIASETDLSRLEALTYLQMIMVMLINYYRDHLLAADAFDRWQSSFKRFRPLFEFIDQHYREPISLVCAAGLAGVSKPHFMRSFKRLAGQSFDTYVNHFRVVKAQILLATTDLPISAVGQEVGFSDQSYFGLIFRRTLQLTPREYRKSLERR